MSDTTGDGSRDNDPPTTRLPTPPPDGPTLAWEGPHPPRTPPSGPLPHAWGPPTGPVGPPFAAPPTQPGFGYAPPRPAAPVTPLAVAAGVVALVAGPLAIPLAHVARAHAIRTQRRGAGLATAAMGLAYAWLGALSAGGLSIVLFSVFLGTQGYQPVSQSAATAPATASEVAGTPTGGPAAATAPVLRTSPPPGATPCARTAPAANGYNQSARGTDVTSCEFAEAVRLSYAGGGAPAAPRDVVAFSPVTQRSYTMRCTPVSDYVQCLGGENAVVFVYAG